MNARDELKSGRTPRKSKGFAVTTELVLITTITVLGLTAGLTILRDATTAELNDVAEAVGSLNQSFGYHGIQASLGEDNTGVGAVDPVGGAFSAGSLFSDGVDGVAGDAAGWRFLAPGDEGAENPTLEDIDFGAFVEDTTV